jgi:hypothetical protein
MPSRELLETLVPQHWDSQEPEVNSGFNRMRWLQGLNDLLKRPVLNRLSATAPNTAVLANGNAQSTGIGVGPLQPKRYAEFTVKARVTFNVNSIGPVYLFVYRTLAPAVGSGIPADGAAPNAGDVIVSGDSFAGGAMTAGVNESGTLSFLDSGLDVTKKYSYYFAVVAPNGNVLNLVNASQLLVMERS